MVFVILQSPAIWGLFVRCQCMKVMCGQIKCQREAPDTLNHVSVHLLLGFALVIFKQNRKYNI